MTSYEFVICVIQLRGYQVRSGGKTGCHGYLNGMTPVPRMISNVPARVMGVPWANSPSFTTPTTVFELGCEVRRCQLNAGFCRWCAETTPHHIHIFAQHDGRGSYLLHPERYCWVAFTCRQVGQSRGLISTRHRPSSLKVFSRRLHTMISFLRRISKIGRSISYCRYLLMNNLLHLRW